MSNLIDKAEGVVIDAVDQFFPDLALIASGAPEDAVLIDLLVRVNPDVKILWLGDEAGLERVKSKYYVTPIRVRGSLETAIHAWGLKAVLRSERRSPAFERQGDVRVIRPLASWTLTQVREYLRQNAVPVDSGLAALTQGRLAEVRS